VSGIWGGGSERPNEASDLVTSSRDWGWGDAMVFVQLYGNAELE
jgi:hypothetical protein